MPGTIVNLRGTSGAGKSTLAFNIMESHPTAELVAEDAEGRKRVEAYEVLLKPSKPLYIIGRYATQCGGCDTIAKAEDVIALVDKYAALGHVLFEGLLISSYWGKIGDWSAQYGSRFVFAYLNTPLEVCLRRVKERRAAAGNTKPFDAGNTTRRVAAIEATRQRAIDEKRNVAILDWQGNAVVDLLALFRERK